METEKAGKTNGSNLWSDSEDREHCSRAPGRPHFTAEGLLLQKELGHAGVWLLYFHEVKTTFQAVLSHSSSCFSLLLLLVCTQPRLQISAQALPPTETRFALLLHTLCSSNMGAAGILHGLKPTLPWLSCLQAFANSGLLLEEAMMRPVGMGIKQGLSVQGSIV